MTRYDSVSAFILSGGASSRMGTDKGSLIIAGQPLVLRTARLVEPLVAAVTVVGGSSKQCAALGLHSVPDGNFGGPHKAPEPQGPLVGMATALATTSTLWNLILACDLPYLTREWLDWLLARAMNSGRRIVMPRTSGGLEPLSAVYRRECAEPIADSLARGVRKVTDALEQFPIEYLDENEWRHLDPGGRILRNMNSPADYEEARQWLEPPRRNPSAR